MATIRALVKPELLKWARDRAKVKLEDAAKAAHVSVERLEAWESDSSDDAPTLGQLRELAAKYHFPLAVFYLPEPPKDFALLRDFRRLRDAEEEPISANLAFHYSDALLRPRRFRLTKQAEQSIILSARQTNAEDLYGSWQPGRSDAVDTDPAPRFGLYYRCLLKRSRCSGEPAP
jgi:transcriptional regulator with XRE-family HTH domain